MTKNNSTEDFVMILIGNKCDISPKDIRVTNDMATEYAKNHNMEYFETSAKTGKGVKELFRYIAQKIVE